MSNEKERPTFEFHFHDKVGQNIANVEHMEVHFDKDMQMQVQNVESMTQQDIPTPEQCQEPELCIALNASARALLRAAEVEGIIVYNARSKGYELGACSSRVLVAYLCGSYFCHDYTDELGSWREGKRFEDAKYCEQLFGFDVAATRRSARSSGAGKSPIGHERVDNLFKKHFIS